MLILKYLGMQLDADSVGLLQAVTDAEFIFGIFLVIYLCWLIQLLRRCSQMTPNWLQQQWPLQAVLKFRNNDCEYDNMLDVATEYSIKLGIQPQPTKNKRKRTLC